jgi:hypothetical protein
MLYNQNKQNIPDNVNSYIEKTGMTSGLVVIKLRRRADNTMAKRKRSSNDLQNTTLKTKDRATLAPLKRGAELSCYGRVSNFCSTSDTSRVTVKRHDHHMIWESCPFFSVRKIIQINL